MDRRVPSVFDSPEYSGLTPGRQEVSPRPDVPFLRLKTLVPTSPGPVSRAAVKFQDPSLFVFSFDTLNDPPGVRVLFV